MTQRTFLCGSITRRFFLSYRNSPCAVHERFSELKPGQIVGTRYRREVVSGSPVQLTALLTSPLTVPFSPRLSAAPTAGCCRPFEPQPSPQRRARARPPGSKTGAARGGIGRRLEGAAQAVSEVRPASDTSPRGRLARRGAASEEIGGACRPATCADGAREAGRAAGSARRRRGAVMFAARCGRLPPRRHALSGAPGVSEDLQSGAQGGREV